MNDGLTTVEVAGVDGVVDDAVLVELVVKDLHLDLEELVLPACVQNSSRIQDYSAILNMAGSWKQSKGSKLT
jgi:hypothetical protein